MKLKPGMTVLRRHVHESDSWESYTTWDEVQIVTHTNEWVIVHDPLKGEEIVLRYSEVYIPADTCLCKD